MCARPSYITNTTLGLTILHKSNDSAPTRLEESQFCFVPAPLRKINVITAVFRRNMFPFKFVSCVHYLSSDPIISANTASFKTAQLLLQFVALCTWDLRLRHNFNNDGGFRRFHSCSNLNHQIHHTWLFGHHFKEMAVPSQSSVLRHFTSLFYRVLWAGHYFKNELRF